MLLMISISIIALLSVNVINTSMNVVCSVSWLITVNIMIVIRVSKRIQTSLYYTRYIMLPPSQYYNPTIICYGLYPVNTDVSDFTHYAYRLKFL